jgi:benzoyl-CoA 2,3-dioxygenase component B
VVSEEEWTAGVSRWLPTAADEAHVHALMQPVREPGRMASWVAPPSAGVHAKPLDYEYVRA